jgi:hypothetical protein
MEQLVLTLRVLHKARNKRRKILSVNVYYSRNDVRTIGIHGRQSNNILLDLGWRTKVSSHIRNGNGKPSQRTIVDT